MDIEKLFGDHHNMIREQAHSFNRTTGFDYSELYSQGLVVFMNAVRKWDGVRKFSTLLGVCLRRDFIKLTQRMDQPPDPETREDEISRSPSPADTLLGKERVEGILAGLSAEARHVVRLMLEGPAEALGILGSEPPRVIRGAVHRYLVHKRGKTHEQSWTVLRELRTKIEEEIPS